MDEERRVVERRIAENRGYLDAESVVEDLTLRLRTGENILDLLAPILQFRDDPTMQDLVQHSGLDDILEKVVLPRAVNVYSRKLPGLPSIRVLTYQQIMNPNGYESTIASEGAIGGFFEDVRAIFLALPGETPNRTWFNKKVKQQEKAKSQYQDLPEYFSLKDVHIDDDVDGMILFGNKEVTAFATILFGDLIPAFKEYISSQDHQPEQKRKPSAVLQIGMMEGRGRLLLRAGVSFSMGCVDIRQDPVKEFYVIKEELRPYF